MINDYAQEIVETLSKRIITSTYDDAHNLEAGLRSRQSHAIIDFICELFPEAVAEWVGDDRDVESSVVEEGFDTLLADNVVLARDLKKALEAKDRWCKDHGRAIQDLGNAHKKLELAETRYQKLSAEYEALIDKYDRIVGNMRAAIEEDDE